MTMDRRAAFGLWFAFGGALAATSAQAEDQNLFQKAIAEAKPLVDLRLRLEDVDQDPLAEDAHAITLRARLGFETGKIANTSLLVEGGAVLPMSDDYRPDPLVPTKTTFPVVADEETYTINRLQLTNTSLPGTTLTAGRQRILLDDQRFIGNSGWRQNEQTFDAFRVVNKSVKNLTLDATYLNQVNRVNGPESPQGRYDGDSLLFNAGYQTKAGRITAYGYLLGFDDLPRVPAAVRDSSSTVGMRFAGERPVGGFKLGYSAAYARQTDYADNPIHYDVGYKALEINGTFKQFGAGVGVEVLEGDGVKGFTTPLATLHKFQGWADKFTATPPNGIEDKYLNLSATFKALGFIDSLGFVVSYHDFEAERISADYGSEWDASIAAKHKHFNLLLKYADYQQGVLASARDTSKLWVQMEFVL